MAYELASDEVVTIAKDCTLDLGEFTLTVPTPKNFVVSSKVEFVNGTIALGASTDYGMKLLGGADVTVNCSITKTKNAGVFDIYGATVTIGENADIDAEYEVFRFKDDISEVPGITSYVNINGGKLSSSGYCMIYHYKNHTANISITAGEITCPKGLIYRTADYPMNFTLTDACKAKFSTDKMWYDGSTKTGVTLPADGYEFVKGGDEWYTIQKIPPKVAKVGDVEYPTLAAAAAALTGAEDETIELLMSYELVSDEVVTIAKDCTLDLGKFTLTVPTPKNFVVSSKVEFVNGTIALGASTDYGMKLLGGADVTVNCSITKTKNAGVFDIYGATVTIGEDADIDAEYEVFRFKDDISEVPGITSYVNINGGKLSSSGYCMIYHYKNHTANISITAGEITCPKGLIYRTADYPMNFTLTDACKAKFSTDKMWYDGSTKTGVTLPADGYEFVKGEDEMYTIVEIPSFDVTFTQNNESIVGSTKTVLRDTVLTADYLPTVEGGTWDVNPIGAIITSATNFNYTVAVGPTWPEDWPADVPETMKEAFATWAEGKGELDFSLPAVQNAFLMNTEVGAVPELKIESISVEGTTATIVVSATDKNLETGINGVLYIDAANDLTNWTTTEVETNADFTDGKATFTVDAAKFMKAKVGFKAPVVE